MLTRPATVNTPASALTLRQRQIVLLICDGLTAKEMAARLDISSKTVEFHKQEICKKLGLEARQSNITRNDLFRAGGVLLSLSSFGVVQGITLDRRPLNQSPLTGRIHTDCVATVRSEVVQAAW